MDAIPPSSNTAHPSSGATRTPDRLTVLVFKDGFASRTFQIPLSWFSRFGLLAGGLAAVTTLTAILAVKSFRAAHRASPERVENLENELSDSRASYKLLEAKLAEKAAEAPKIIDSPAPAMTLTTAQAQQPLSAPVPTVTVTVTPTSALLGPLVLATLPGTTRAAPTDPTSISIELHAPRASWFGKNLNVSFDLQYSRPDKGSQQGRIVVLARGPETLLGYPEGVLNLSSRDNLVAPEKGEYFSVSRFRAVKAEFQTPKHGSIREAEILVFDGNANLLIHTKIEPTASGSNDEIESSRIVPTPLAPDASTPLPGPVMSAGSGISEPKKATPAPIAKPAPVKTTAIKAAPAKPTPAAAQKKTDTPDSAADQYEDEYKPPTSAATPPAPEAPTQ